MYIHPNPKGLEEADCDAGAAIGSKVAGLDHAFCCGGAPKRDERRPPAPPAPAAPPRPGAKGRKPTYSLICRPLNH